MQEAVLFMLFLEAGFVLDYNSAIISNKDDVVLWFMDHFYRICNPVKFLFFFRIGLISFLMSYTGMSSAEGPFDTYWYNEPAYQNASGNFQFYYGGYWQGDLLAFENAPELQPGFHWRAGRTAVGALLYKAWQIDVSYDFSDSLLYDAYVTYIASSTFTILGGQFNPVFGLANTTDTPNIDFLELPLSVIVFSPNYLPGVQLGIFKDPVTIYASIFGPALGSTVHGKDPWGEIVSVTYVPIHAVRRLVYFSLSGWNQSTDSDHTAAFAPFPELWPRNNGSIIDTGNMIDVNYFTVLDAATAVMYGSFGIQSEYIETWVNRAQNRPTLRFEGYYVTANYFLTGESREYNFRQAGFIGITPIQSKYGAWEVAARFSHLSLQNRDILGGRESNISAELSWYPLQYVKIMLNYIRSMARPNSNGVNQDSNLYGFRAQLTF